MRCLRYFCQLLEDFFAEDCLLACFFFALAGALLLRAALLRGWEEPLPLDEEGAFLFDVGPVCFLLADGAGRCAEPFAGAACGAFAPAAADSPLR